MPNHQQVLILAMASGPEETQDSLGVVSGYHLQHANTNTIGVGSNTNIQST